LKNVLADEPEKLVLNPLRISSLLAAALCTILFGSVLLQFSQGTSPPGVPERWSLQFEIFLGIDTLATFLTILLSQKKLYGVVPFGIQLLMSLVMSMAEGNRVGIRVALYSSSIVTGALCFPPVYNLIFAGLALLVTSLVPGNQPFWRATETFLPPSERIAIVTILAVVLLMSCAISLILAGIHRLRERIEHQKRTVVQLTSANVGFQEYARYVDEQSRDQERKKITGEIHDTIGFTLMTVIMLLREGQLLAKTGRINKILLQADNHAAEGLEKIRRSLRILRSIEVSAPSVALAGRKIAESFAAATGVKVEFDSGNAVGPFSAEVVAVVVGMVEEGLTNSLRHGKATSVRVSFLVDANVLIVDILDNGQGPMNVKEGIGLAAMRERVEQLNGTLETVRTGFGFLVTGRIPVGPRLRAKREEGTV
jgi:signal transduction histidine kinase